jgi:hypothetical protein
MTVDNTQQQSYDPVAALTRYLNERSKPTAREQKEKLTPEGYRIQRAKLNKASLRQRDAPTTKENINGLMKKWKKYVQESCKNRKELQLIHMLGTAHTNASRAGQRH